MTYEQIMWGINFLIILEAASQLHPLIKRSPIASRKACLVGMLKYGLTMLVNMWFHNYAMGTWLLIGFIKDGSSLIMLCNLKKEYKELQ